MKRTTTHLGSNIKERGSGIFSSKGSQGKNQTKIGEVPVGYSRHEQARYQKKLTDVPRFPIPSGQ